MKAHSSPTSAGFRAGIPATAPSWSAPAPCASRSRRAPPTSTSGEEVFAEIRARPATAADGPGQRAASGAGYQFPPLWGPDSYNDGAGMTACSPPRPIVKHNMPFGTTYDAPVLSDEDAYDVAGFINSQRRGRRRPISTTTFRSGCKSRSIRRTAHTLTISARPNTSWTRSRRSAPK